VSDHNDTPGDLGPIFDDEQAEARIRKVWEDGRWFLSVVDVIGLLTDSDAPNKYWTDMKRRIQDEGFVELAAKCRRFKLKAADPKLRETECADTETMLRIVQSIPHCASPLGAILDYWRESGNGAELNC